MAAKPKKSNYFYETDILEVIKNKKEKLHYSMRFGHFVFNFNSKNKIIGLEIMEASKNLGVAKKYLKDNVVGSNLTVLNQPGAIGFKLELVLIKNRKKEVQNYIFNVPREEKLLTVRA